MDVRELYQEVIVDHGTRPRHVGRCDSPTASCDGHNPLCGDQLTLTARVVDGRLEDLQFTGSGCAISMASASLMAEALQGKTEAEALALFERFHAAVAEGDEPDPSLGKLAVLVGVRAYPMRVKCATLAWHTLKSLLAQESEVACTA